MVIPYMAKAHHDVSCMWKSGGWEGVVIVKKCALSLSHTHTHTHTHARTHAHKLTHTNSCTQTHRGTHAPPTSFSPARFQRARTHTHTHARAHMRAHTHTQTHTHTHTHAHRPSLCHVARITGEGKPCISCAAAAPGDTTDVGKWAEKGAGQTEHSAAEVGTGWLPGSWGH